MALSQGSTREELAKKFTELGSWVAVYQSGGSTEASGGSPAYARKQTTWSAGTPADGIYVGSQVEIDLPAGTYSHVGIFDSVTGGNLIEKKAITSKTLDGQGKLLITPTITIS